MTSASDFQDGIAHQFQQSRAPRAVHHNPSSTATTAAAIVSVPYNGYPSNGPSTINNNNSTKIVISNLPSSAQYEEIEAFLNQYGRVEEFEKINRKEGPTQVLRVSFETTEQAQHALASINNVDYQGHRLKVDVDRRSNRGAGNIRNTRNTSNYGAVSRPADFPLRILVPSEMVGAIIGRQGSTIKQITQQTRARVDVHRKDNMGAVEKAITIFGNPENCTQACKKILEVMQQEASSTNKPDITLKILAYNNLIGRIIGKQGNTIKRIMQETDTKIAVSNVMGPTSIKYEYPFRNLQDLAAFTMERVITVKGSIENMSKAEALISAKLRQSYENDLQAMAGTPQSMMFPGLPPMTVMTTPGLGYSPRGGPTSYQTPLYGTGTVPYPSLYQPGPPAPAYGIQTSSDTQETVYLYIPNQAVGAIIGTKGSQIKNMIRISNASIKIATVEGDKDSNERKVTIVGTAEAQWKAQYLIFEKMREEGFGNGLEEVRLTIEILVPSSQVGRIIGRGGHNVRELQRGTGAMIKLPEHNPNAASAANPPSEEDTTAVHIIGTFLAVQSAQRRIKSMITPGPSSRTPRVRPPAVSSAANAATAGFEGQQ